METPEPSIIHFVSKRQMYKQIVIQMQRGHILLYKFLVSILQQVFRVCSRTVQNFCFTTVTEDVSVHFQMIVSWIFWLQSSKKACINQAVLYLDNLGEKVPIFPFYLRELVKYIQMRFHGYPSTFWFSSCFWTSMFHLGNIFGALVIDKCRSYPSNRLSSRRYLFSFLCTHSEKSCLRKRTRFTLSISRMYFTTRTIHYSLLETARILQIY